MKKKSEPLETLDDPCHEVFTFLTDTQKAALDKFCDDTGKTPDFAVRAAIVDFLTRLDLL
jgi:hypothetical protein